MNIFEETIHEIKVSPYPLVIYGAGWVGRVMYMYLKKNDADIYGFAVDRGYLPENRCLDGLTVYDMDELLKTGRYNVLLAFVDLARDAYKAEGLTVNEDPVRGGTDGSQLTYMGLPCPNLFAGEENMHGRYEYTVLESMWKAVDVLRKINQLNVERNKK